MDHTLSEKESFDLIHQMISTAKNNLQKGMGKIFLLWGYLVAGISLGTFILLVLLPPDIKYHAFDLWCLMALGYPIHYFMIRKSEHNRLVTTYVDQLMRWVWIAFGLSIVLVVLGFFLSTFAFIPGHTDATGSEELQRWMPWLFLPPTMLCLYGFALFVSGKAYGFKPLWVGGIICWLGALFLLITVHHAYAQEIQQLVLCIGAISGYIIPGHLLNKKETAHV